MNFIVILATMTAFWHRGSTQPAERKGKFLGLSSDDMWSDFLDEVDDPLPMPPNKLSVRQHVLQKLQHKQKKPAEPMPPLAIPEQIVQRLQTSTPAPVQQSVKLVANKNTFHRRRNVSQPEPLLVYDSSTHKFELTPPGFASHAQPITEGMFVIGGQFGQQSETHHQNMTEEKPKLFWNSLGDFIETVPFLPIQVNVPDLLAAMASFFSDRVPLINRITNPNKPRPNIKVSDISDASPPHMADFPVESSLLEYRQMAAPITARPKKNKKRKQNKKKNRRTTESYRIRGSYQSVTKAPKNQATSRTWFPKPTQMPLAKETTTETLKLFHHNNSPDAEQVKLKNMPITRKNNRWADREFFNFKNSDISNSPIMILNMPNRPVLMYKYNHEYKAVDPLNKNKDKYISQSF